MDKEKILWWWSIKIWREYLYDYRLKGKHYINERLEFEGEYLLNKKYNGKGYDENGNIIYELKMEMVKLKNMTIMVN